MQIRQFIIGGRYTVFDRPVDGVRLEIGEAVFEVRDDKGVLRVSTINSKKGIAAAPVSPGVVAVRDLDHLDKE